MKKIINIIAYFWAGFSFLFLLSVFMNMGGYQQLLVQLPFMKLDPLYLGGKVVKTIDKSNYSLQIHEPVFSALIGESDEGYVQVDVLSDEMLAISDTLDANADGINDFRLQIENKELSVIPLVETCHGLWMYCRTDGKWMARVYLDNSRK